MHRQDVHHNASGYRKFSTQIKVNMRTNVKLLFLIATVFSGICILLQPNYPHLMDWKVVAVFQFLLALSLTVLTKQQDKKVRTMVPAGLLTATFIKIIIEGIADPTSHNLWPIELIYLAVIAYPSALIGTGLGLLMKRVSVMLKTEK